MAVPSDCLPCNVTEIFLYLNFTEVGLLCFLINLCKFCVINCKYCIIAQPRKLNDPYYRDVPCGSSHGVGTARALAKLTGILANGGVWNDKMLISPAAIQRLQSSLSSEFDRVVLRDITYGPGTTIINIEDEQHQVICRFFKYLLSLCIWFLKVKVVQMTFGSQECLSL